MSAKENKGTEKMQLPVVEGFMTTALSPPEQVCLTGSRCLSCGVALLGKRHACENCASTNLEDVIFSKRGTVYSYTIVLYPPPQPYAGSVAPFIPYPIAWVDLPEGARILSTLTDCKPDEVKIGMEVELVVEKGWEDEKGNEVMIYKFKPVNNF
ncbi:MAG: Zn-ribbon domain-containing OB-fold protein [Pseudomonadota bacterium]